MIDRRAAWILAAGAVLFVALGGSAIAANGLIHAGDIAPGAVTSRAIRNGGVEPGDLSVRTRALLQAGGTVAGPKGETGSAGAAGTNGANGANGSQLPTVTGGGGGTHRRRNVPDHSNPAATLADERRPSMLVDGSACVDAARPPMATASIVAMMTARAFMLVLQYVLREKLRRQTQECNAATRS